MSLNIIVEVDPDLCTYSPRRASALARGVTVRRCPDGTVEIHRLPTLCGAVSFDSMHAAVRYLHDLAGVQAELAEASGGGRTATGRWLLDRAAFLREVARVIVVRHRSLWPKPSAIDVLRSLAREPSGQQVLRREASCSARRLPMRTEPKAPSCSTMSSLCALDAET